MPVMEHDETPHRPTTAGRSSAAGDSTATEKLRMLTAELLRDPIVAARIRADSSLRRRWETGNVAKQLARPPR
jgi:hypothetical protein